MRIAGLLFLGAIALTGAHAEAQQGGVAPRPGPGAARPPSWGQPTPQPPRASQPDQFCQPGIEIRCSCGFNHWEKTRCRADGTNWEFCPCPEWDRREGLVHPDRPSPRSTGMIAGGIALTTVGAITIGTSLALKAADIPSCPHPTESNPCIAAYVGLAGGGLVFTAVGVPLWVYGAAKVRADERPRDTALMATGSVAAAFGVVAISGGVTTVAVGNTIGWAPIIAGGVGLTGGVLLAVYGAWEVPDVPEPVEQGLGPRHVVPEVLVGPTSATLRWRF